MNVWKAGAAAPIDHAYTARDSPDFSRRCVCGALAARHPDVIAYEDELERERDAHLAEHGPDEPSYAIAGGDVCSSILRAGFR